MDPGVLLGGSLLAATVAGTIALLAPCCFSVTLPAYFAGSVQNRRASNHRPDEGRGGRLPAPL